MKRRKIPQADRVAVADAFKGAAWYLSVSPQLKFFGGSTCPNRWHRFWQRVLLGWRWSWER